MSDNPKMSLAEPDRLASLRRRLAVMRWWLLAGLTLAVLSAPTFLDIALPLSPLLAVLLLLAGFNVVAQWRAGGEAFGAPELAGQLAVDLVGMGILLYLAGGATNPLVSLLLLPVAVAALSLPGRWVAGIAGLAVGLYSFLMRYSLPLPIGDAERATRLHLGGMWLTFVVSAVLLAWFVTRMTASLRDRDALLAAAREEALRAAQVVALGQLAAGAAHELGTPLATMNILAGELVQDARLPEDAHEDLTLLRQQIAICKEIVGNLINRAGIERAGMAQKMPVDAWLAGLLARWRTLWPQATCILDMQTTDTPPQLVVEATLEQAITNLLNNAAKIAPDGMRLVVAWDASRLRIALHDQGPGFPPDVLRCCGAEPLPAHAQGAGIGLWLTRAAVERSGGRLHLENQPTGGAAILELPISPIPPLAVANTKKGPSR
jgi:two-component system sensor histidine kinase RegB